jgi:hypothetical protein
VGKVQQNQRASSHSKPICVHPIGHLFTAMPRFTPQHPSPMLVAMLIDAREAMSLISLDYGGVTQIMIVGAVVMTLQGAALLSWATRLCVDGQKQTAISEHVRNEVRMRGDL